MSTAVTRYERIEHVVRHRFGIRRTDVQMHFCRMKNGVVTMMFYVFDRNGNYHMTTLNSTRPSLGPVLDHIRKELDNHECRRI